MKVTSGDIRGQPRVTVLSLVLGVEGRRPGMADEGRSELADAAADAEAVIPDADADMLVTEAVRQREEQRSGRSMGRQLRLVAGCALAGVLLIAGGGYLGRAVAAAAVVVGVLIIAVAGLLLVRALDLSPATQWGEPAAEPCPACGEHSLREDRVAVPDANAIVALCTAECGYAEVSPDPHGPPEHGRWRPWK